MKTLEDFLSGDEEVLYKDTFAYALAQEGIMRYKDSAVGGVLAQKEDQEELRALVADHATHVIISSRDLSFFLANGGKVAW